MNRPAKKNAANAQMWNELLETFRDVAASDEDRVMVLTGAGGEFCAGADLTGGGTGGPNRHHLSQMRHVGDVAVGIASLADTDHREGTWRRCGRGLQHGPRL